MSFEIIEHTADIGIHSKGKNLEEAFREAGRGMFSIITDLDKVEKKKELNIVLKQDDWEDLLVSFLSELIYLHEVKDMLFCDFDVELRENDKKELNVIGKGEKMDLDKHKMHTAVKAVSYHELLVDLEGEVKVIFDV